MKPRTLTIILVVLLVGSNLFWLFQIFDAGVSLACRDSELGYVNASLDAAIDLANMNPIGLTAGELMGRLLVNRDADSIFEKNDGCMYVDQVCVQLDANRTVVEIKLNAM